MWTLPFASLVFVGTGAALVVERGDSGSDVGHELCLTGALVEVIESVVVMMGRYVSHACRHLEIRCICVMV